MSHRGLAASGETTVRVIAELLRRTSDQQNLHLADEGIVGISCADIEDGTSGRSHFVLVASDGGHFKIEVSQLVDEEDS